MRAAAAATHSRPGRSLPANSSDWIVDGTVRDDYRQFSYDRISSGDLFNQSFGGNRV